jgi:hypothetical protein
LRVVIAYFIPNESRSHFHYSTFNISESIKVHRL